MMDPDDGTTRPLPPHETLPVVLAPKKTAPPEPAEHVRRRGYIILSFWAVIILLGLPIWRWTTSIYRATLPVGEMTEWAEGKACRLVFPLQISIQAPSLQEAERQHLIRLTQHALDDLNDFSAHHLRLQLSQADGAGDGAGAGAGEGAASDGSEAALVVQLTAGGTSAGPQATLDPHAPVLHLRYGPQHVPPPSTSSSALSSFLAGQLQDIFAEEQAMIAQILSGSSSSSSSTTTTAAAGLVSGSGSGSGGASMAASAPGGGGGSSAMAREARGPTTAGRSPVAAAAVAEVGRRMGRAAKYAPTYHLTFSLFTPGARPSSWAIEAALAAWLRPLLAAIAPISNFTVDTQVQLYARFSPSVRAPTFDATRHAWTLSRDDLSRFINAAEWPLSPSIGAAPTFHFVVYVPSPARSPLVVRETGGDSWLVPPWGGVTILNLPLPLPLNQQHLSAARLQAPLATMARQLLALLGAPRSPPSQPLRLATLARTRAASVLLSAAATLGALARLTAALPSIPIPRPVATSVEHALAHLAASCAHLRDGRFEPALRHARQADAAAERAFFHKSMVGQVYFPDEHKVAVYLPLLGPVAVPLLMAAARELRRRWAAWRRTRTRTSPTAAAARR
ncbi:MAG: GPI transamidase component [Phylliscum demangeonii]|nr:MAG: GPI transamidase component [Phylliscum demangeonii]